MYKTKFIILILFICFIIYYANINTYHKNYITAQGLEIRKYMGLDSNNYKNCTGKKITVAILDSGIKPNNNIETNRILCFKDFVNNNPNLYDDYGHGTFVAGIIGANGNITGIAPEVNFIILKVLDSNGKSDRDTMLKALTWISKYYDEYNIKVVNISIGVTAYLDYFEDPLCNIIENLNNNGVFVICSSGNKGLTSKSTQIQSPGISPYAITVSSSKNSRTYKFSDDKLASFSANGINYGTFTKPDLVVPGVDILSIYGDTYKTLSGTSFSCAIVAGVISILCEKHPNKSITEIREILFANTKTIKKELQINQGHGQLIFSNK